MKKFVHIVCCCFLLVGLSSIARAEPVRGLYQVSLSVANQDKSTYNQSVTEAFQQVLVKVSGDSQVLVDSSIQQEITKASSYVSAFSYQPYENSPQDKQLLAWKLTIHFDPQLINRLLTQTQQAIWGQDRPQVMVWLAEQRDGNRRLIGGGEDSPMAQEVDHLGQQRGVDLLLPMLDLDDLKQITVDDVWTSSLAAIKSATHRYGTDAVLAGRIYPDPQKAGAWLGDWEFELVGQQQQWTNHGDSEQQVVAMGINQMVNNLAAKYAVVSGNHDQSQVQISIYGVDNVAQYSKVSRYLKGIALVNQLTLATIGSDYVTFKLKLQGSQQQLVQTFSVDHILQPDKAQQNPQQPLAYRLVA